MFLPSDASAAVIGLAGVGAVKSLPIPEHCGFWPNFKVLLGSPWVNEKMCHERAAASRASRALRGACGAPGPHGTLVT